MQPDSTNAMVYHFFDTSTGNPFYWLWDFGDGTISNEQHPTHLYAETGWYEVCLTIIGQGMTDTYCSGFEMNAGALNIATPGLLITVGEIFPNPNKGSFAINLDLIKPTDVTISVINYLGQQVYNRKESLQNGNSKLMFNLTDLPEGIYNMMIISESQKITKKFIIR
jgi:hypothetical protein